MRQVWLAVVAAGLLSTPVGAEEPVLKTKKDKVSYAMAVGMAKTVQRQGMEIDAGVFAMGLHDALSGGKLLMTPDEMKAILGKLASDFKKRQERAGARAGEQDPKK